MGIVHKLASEIASEQRRELARHVANLFFIAEREGMARARTEQFSEIFVAMLDHLDLDQQVRLSEHFSRSPDASQPLVRKMSVAEAPIAQSVLQYSPLLEEDDLLHVSEQLTTQHRLAVSRRGSGLTTRVTDSLIRFGETPVLRSVTENRAAEISENGFMALASHAMNDNELLARLSNRVEMPAGCAQAILPRLKGESRAKLAALAADKAAVLETLVSKAKSEEARHKLSVRQQRLEAKALAKEVADGRRRLDDVAIMLSLERRPHALATIFAERSKLPESKCSDAIFEVKGELLAFLCRSLALSVAAYEACEEMRRDFLRLPSADPAALELSYAGIDAREARKTLHLISVVINVH
jgi:uncharacterized protein (DUF2336 family)